MASLSPPDVNAWFPVMLLMIGAAAVATGTGPGEQTPAERTCAAAELETADSPGRLGPSVVVRREDHDFGRMETDNTGQCEFEFTNAGDQPLTLEQGRTSCGCCTCVCQTILPDSGSIPPGESEVVTLKWTIKRFTGAYFQSSTVLTNDPKRREVTLAVSGRIVPAVRIVPWQLILSSALVGHKETAEVRVYGYRPQPLRITGCRLSDPSTADFFETAVVPLTSQEVSEEEDATSGAILRVKLKPGLPLGPFRQRIILSTNLNSPSTLEVPIEGRIVDPISIVGPGWDDRAGAIVVTRVAGGEATHRPLMLIVRGPDCLTTDFKLVRSVPECVDVELGETTAINDGGSARTPLSIRISAESPPGDGPGTQPTSAGWILIETNHPQQPELRIPINFSTKE